MLASSQSGAARDAESVRPGDGISRCEREQAEILATRNLPAWVTTLALEDWEAEKRLIEKASLLDGRSQLDGSGSPRRPKHQNATLQDAPGRIAEGRGGV
jgi:hypothetical protein